MLPLSALSPALSAAGVRSRAPGACLLIAAALLGVSAQTSHAGDGTAPGDTRWSATFGHEGFDATVYAIASLNGVVYAGGAFTKAGGVPCNHIAQWDGADGWKPLGSGTDRWLRAGGLSGYSRMRTTAPPCGASPSGGRQSRSRP